MLQRPYTLTAEALMRFTEHIREVCVQKGDKVIFGRVCARSMRHHHECLVPSLWREVMGMAADITHTRTHTRTESRARLSHSAQGIKLGIENVFIYRI